MLQKGIVLIWMLHTQKEENKHICKHRENENMLSAEYSEKFMACDTYVCCFSKPWFPKSSKFIPKLWFTLSICGNGKKGI